MTTEKITLLYNERKHDENELIEKVVVPYIKEVHKAYEDFEEFYSQPNLPLPGMDGLNLVCNESGKAGFDRFVKGLSVNLENLAGSVYFVRSLKRGK